jgi:enoyl-[acyl-carrier protein] reductase/trans-2-enoyl-CoA reductase (NAD+)
LTAHPDGCEQNIKNQIEYVKSKGAINGAKKVLVIGASTGFGLASRISSAFGSDAATIGVFFENRYSRKNSFTRLVQFCCFEKKHKSGLYAKSVNGDAFLMK